MCGQEQILLSFALRDIMCGGSDADVDGQDIRLPSYQMKLSFWFWLLPNRSRGNIGASWNYTLNKSSTWYSLKIGHPLCLIFARSMKDMTLKICICNSMTLIIRLPYYRLKYCFWNCLTLSSNNWIKQRWPIRNVFSVCIFSNFTLLC